MLLARISEEKYANLYRGGKIFGGVFIGKGQEALSASLGMLLRKTDIFAPLIRDQAGRLAFGEPLIDATRTYLGSKLGPMRGRDGNVHRGRPREGYLPMISHLGAMISVVNGMLMARRMRGEEGSIGVSCLGEGGTSTGAFHEAINMAAVERLPLIMVVANNQYAYSTPSSLQFACEDLADKAIGYGIQSWKVDATSLADCLETVGASMEAARAGGGPQLIVAKLLRLAGHGEHDDPTYISQDLKASPLGSDCLLRAEKEILDNNWGTAEEIARWKADAVQQVEEVVATVQREAAPDPSHEEWTAISTGRLRDGFPVG